MDEVAANEPQLCLRFLDGYDVRLNGVPVHLETAKTRALLVYLLLTPAPQSRHRLMGLLWGDMPEASARRNLRRALWNLRHQIVLPGFASPIIADREMVSFNRAFPHWLDVEIFSSACDTLERLTSSSARPLPTDELDTLRRAVELHSEGFLASFYVGDAPAFEEWALARREELRMRALTAFHRLVELYAARGEDETALSCARRLLALEPWDEAAHRWVMRLLARSGQREAALTQYETCRRLLAEGLGVEPGRETKLLYEQIRIGVFEPRRANLPAPTTPFVGREHELQELATLLALPECRLLTITGLGGVGKSRLALEVARQRQADFAHGVHYVDLEALNQPERLPATLVQSLELPLTGEMEPEETLRAYLRTKQMLLVLDGFEHLLPGAPFLDRILQAAPQVKVIVASRERLNLSGEWVYPLGGLELADAVCLFVQTARRLALGFQVAAEEQPHLERICRLVEGLPLAVEMAAAWVRLLPLKEIASGIFQQLNLLDTSRRAARPRHGSIRAVFDHSWQLLSTEERTVFRRLAVFPAAFRAQEAARVTGARPSLFLALVDKSLLQRMPTGHYRLHPLLRQYALEHLQEEGAAAGAVWEAHARTYADLLARQQDIAAQGPTASSQGLPLHEMDNFFAAWKWALEQRNLPLLEQMYLGMAGFYHLRASYLDGVRLFSQALDTIGWPQEEGDGDDDLLRWKLLSIYAAFLLYLGRLSTARLNLEQCLLRFEAHGLRTETAYCRFYLGEIARFTGKMTEARAFFTRSRDEHRQIGNRAGEGFCLNGLGLVALAEGRLEEARAFLRRGLEIFRYIGHDMGRIIVSINLGTLLVQMEDYEAARAILEESYIRCGEIGHRWGMAVSRLRLGDIAHQRGDLIEAEHAYRESLALLSEVGQRRAAITCQKRLARLYTEMGNLDEAARFAAQAEVLDVELSSPESPRAS